MASPIWTPDPSSIWKGNSHINKCSTDKHGAISSSVREPQSQKITSYKVAGSKTPKQDLATLLSRSDQYTSPTAYATRPLSVTNKDKTNKSN